MFCRNIGYKSRGIRFGLGLVMMGMGLYYHSWWGAIGVVPILSAVFGHCPMITLCGGIAGGDEKEGASAGGCCGHHDAKSATPAKSP